MDTRTIMALDRIEDYHDAEGLTRAVIDYFALKREIPRQYDADALPKGWKATSRRAIREGIKEEFGVSVSESLPGNVWERIGANNDIDHALDLINRRRDELVEKGLDSIDDYHTE